MSQGETVPLVIHGWTVFALPQDPARPEYRQGGTLGGDHKRRMSTGMDSQRWRAGLVKAGSDSMVMVQRTQRRAFCKSSNSCFSRSGDAMNPNRV